MWASLHVLTTSLSLLITNRLWQIISFLDGNKNALIIYSSTFSIGSIFRVSHWRRDLQESWWKVLIWWKPYCTILHYNNSNRNCSFIDFHIETWRIHPGWDAGAKQAWVKIAELLWLAQCRLGWRNEGHIQRHIFAKSLYCSRKIAGGCKLPH